MKPFQPQPHIAGSRENGVTCLHCDTDLFSGDEVVACPDCGTVHHWHCWQLQDGCGSYECAPARRTETDGGALRITTDDLSRAVTLPAGRVPSAGFPQVATAPAASSSAQTRATNGLAIASLVVALAGIPLFGLVTGLVAIVLGSLALGAMRGSGQRGTGWAVCGVLLGVADMVGWVILLALFLPQDGPALRLADFEQGPVAVEDLPPHIGRAMRANVLIESDGGLLGEVGIGSGVVVSIKNDMALIVTNRHVVDSNFRDGSPDDEPLDFDALTVKLVGQPPQPGRVLWTAPDGVDLALVSVPVIADGPAAARWVTEPPLAVGTNVFAIGNPHGLGWTHTKGSISQLRTQRRGGRNLRVIQTSAAINAGNSGGGLYDESGLLLGFNTWTNDKRTSEGLSFAITFESFWELNPPHLEPPAAREGEREIGRGGGQGEGVTK